MLTTFVIFALINAVGGMVAAIIEDRRSQRKWIESNKSRK